MKAPHSAQLRVLKQVKKVPPEVPAPDTGDSIDTRLQLPPVPEQAGQPSEPAKTVLAPPPSTPQGPKVIACKMSASASAGHVLSEAVAVQNGTVQPTPRSSTTPLDAGVSPSKPPGSREVVAERREFASSVQEDAAGSGEMQATGDLKDDTCEKHLTEGETDFVPPVEAKLSEEEEVDPEMVVMRQEETELLLHQEELLSLGDELRRKIAAERAEIERLRSEIVEYQKLAKYKQYSVESAECSSSGTEGSESEGEDELKQILSQLMDDNKQLSQQAAELSQKILKEREACVDIKVKMRLLQNEAKMLKI